MNAQNTPVHIRLWHHDFWRMAVANFLMAMSVYILIPILPRWLGESQGLTPQEQGLTMGIFGLGLFVFGAFVSFLVQHYRRNMVCLFAMMVVAALHGLLYYFDSQRSQFVGLPLILLQRFALGAVFGLAQMVLSSTLIIDTSESFQRTEANYSAAWFSRFALSLGPMAGLLVERYAGFDFALLSAVGCVCVAIVLVLLVDFPFRVPEDDIPTVSLDRFFLTHGFPLFLNLLLITVAVGQLLALPFSERFYGMVMAGFLLALLSWRFVFRDAELKSEVVTGLILIGAALLMMLTRTQRVVWYAAPLFIGLGTGVIGSRFLLFFIKLSRHCQRGTSQSTFFLGWESGIAIGVGLGIGVLESEFRPVMLTSLVLIVLALIAYHFTHDWFVHHKNR